MAPATGTQSDWRRQHSDFWKPLIQFSLKCAVPHVDMNPDFRWLGLAHLNSIQHRDYRRSPIIGRNDNHNRHCICQSRVPRCTVAPSLLAVATWNGLKRMESCIPGSLHIADATKRGQLHFPTPVSGAVNKLPLLPVMAQIKFLQSGPRDVRAQKL